MSKYLFQKRNIDTHDYIQSNQNAYVDECVLAFESKNGERLYNKSRSDLIKHCCGTPCNTGTYNSKSHIMLSLIISVLFCRVSWVRRVLNEEEERDKTETVKQR